MNEGISIRTFRTPSEIEEIREVWKSWQYHPNADIDFFLTVNRVRPQILRPHVMVLYRDNRPEAMLVGRIVNERIAFKIGYKTILKPRARMLRIASNGLLGNLSRANSEVLVKKILDTLRRGESDLAVLSNVRADSLVYQAATRVPGFLSRDFFPRLQPHRSMTIPATVEDFHRRLSPKVRKNSKWTKLLREFPNRLRIDCIRETDGLERMFRDVEEIAGKTYQRGLGVGFQDSTEMRERLSLEAERGRLRAFILYLAGRPSAFWVGTVYQRTFHGDFVGYDPEYGQYSPGMFLMMRVIEGFCKGQGSGDVAQIDFGCGDAQYKQILCHEQWQEASLLIFAPNVKGFALFLLKTPMALAEHAVRKGLEKVRLLQRVKTLWRRHARGRQQGVPTG